MNHRLTILALGLALASTGGGVAQARTTTHRYAITIASGTERVQFTNGQGTSGVVDYRFRGAPLRGRALVTTAGGRTRRVAASFLTDGLTAARVGSCSSVVRHRADGFTLVEGPQAGRLFFGLHLDPFANNYLHTACPGPTEGDLLAASAVPTGTFTAREFTGDRIRLALNGAQGFQGAAGWSGTTTWRIVYKLAKSSGKVRPATTRGRA